jgi:hypothetical protein
MALIRHKVRFRQSTFHRPMAAKGTHTPGREPLTLLRKLAQELLPRSWSKICWAGAVAVKASVLAMITTQPA